MSIKTLIYISTWDFTNAKSDGVCKKILSQIKVFRKAGFTVDYTYIKDGSTWIGKDEKETLLGHNHYLSKFAAHRLIAKYLKKHDDYKYVYVRYNKADSYFISIVRILKEYGAKIIVEIPTYPYDNECKSCLRDRAVLCVDKIYRNRIAKYIDSFASYSDDKTIFGAPSMHIINGIDIDSIRPINPAPKKDDTINLIGVACFTPSHGYDRLIKAIGRYYENGGSRNLRFHVVGYGEAEKEYRELVSQYHIENHVIFYGKKCGKELDDIYNKMDIGVCSLALFRVIKDAISSELKSREYMAKGLPMIASCSIDVIRSNDFKYVLHVNNDESDINIDRIIEFYDCIYKTDDRVKTIKEIRKYAECNCSIEEVMKPIIRYYIE